LIKFVLDFKIPYTVVVGYKDMPVDALGIPDMSKLLNESKYEVNFKESPFYKPEDPGKNLQIYYLLPQQR
jgi:hypothetical protein